MKKHDESEDRKTFPPPKTNELLNKSLSEADVHKLVSDLEVYQIELELQNKELLLAKEQAEVSARKYSELYDFAPSGYFTLSRLGEIQELNISGARMLGKERSLLISSLFGFFVSEDFRPVFNLFLEKVFQSKMSESCDLSLSANRDHHRHVHLTAIVTDSEEKCLVTMIDISERIHSEIAIKESESRYRSLLNNLDVGVVIHAPDSAIRMSNHKASELLGISEDQMQGKLAIDPNWKFVDENGISLPIENYPVNQIKSRKQSIGNMRLGAYRPVTNDVVWLSVNGFPLFDDQGKIFEILISFMDITSQKLNEDELIKTKEDFKKYFEEESIGRCVTSPEKGWLEVNNRLCQMLGYSKNELLELSWADLTYPDDLDIDDKLFNEVLSGQREAFILDKRFVRKDGSLVYTTLSITCQRKTDGTVDYFLTTLIDNTERKMAEVALGISEDKFRNMVINMQVGVLLQGPNAEITLSNPKALELLGITEDQLMGITSFDPSWNVIHEDGSPFPGNTHPVPQAIATRLTVRNVIMGVYRPLIGDRAWLQVDAVPQLNSDGTVNRVICSFIDISKRKKAEELLQKSQFNLNNAQHMAHLGSWEWDMKANTINFSDEMFMIFGLNEGTSVINVDSLLEFIHPDDKEFYLSNLKNSSLKGESPPFEYRIVRSDGEVRNLLASGHVIFDDNHNPVEGIGIVQDITERKKAEEALRKSENRLRELNSTKDKFFSIIGHDLKTPFNSIIGFSSILIEQVQEKNYEGIEQFAGIIQDSSQRAMDLLQNLLDWSRSQTGKMEFNPEFVELIGLINQVRELLYDAAFQKSITISMNVPRYAPVMADKAMISTVLRNIISNAIKFTYSGGSIMISVNKNPKELVVSVADNGVGMKKEQVDKLFRIDESYSTKGTQNENGTGLGLILCKEFVEKHGGKIGVKSAAENQLSGEKGGSEFYFTLPLVEIRS